MKVYFYKLKGVYYAYTENGYRLFPEKGVINRSDVEYVYEHLNYLIERRGEGGEKVEVAWVYRPKMHQGLCVAILRARVMGDPAADQHNFCMAFPSML